MSTRNTWRENLAWAAIFVLVVAGVTVGLVIVGGNP